MQKLVNYAELCQQKHDKQSGYILLSTEFRSFLENFTLLWKSFNTITTKQMEISNITVVFVMLDILTVKKKYI